MVKRKSDALGDFAEDLGRLLGTTERRALELLAQRKQVAANLTAIRDKASALLKQLSSEHPFPWARNRRPTVKKARRKTKTVKKSARKTKRASRDETGKG